AEDGIRDATVTGVQTCALPISMPWIMQMQLVTENSKAPIGSSKGASAASYTLWIARVKTRTRTRPTAIAITVTIECWSFKAKARSEERRVGKECRSRGGRDQ